MFREKNVIFIERIDLKADSGSIAYTVSDLARDWLIESGSTHVIVASCKPWSKSWEQGMVYVCKSYGITIDEFIIK